MAAIQKKLPARAHQQETSPFSMPAMLAHKPSSNCRLWQAALDRVPPWLHRLLQQGAVVVLEQRGVAVLREVL